MGHEDRFDFAGITNLREYHYSNMFITCATIDLAQPNKFDYVELAEPEKFDDFDWDSNFQDAYSK